MEALTNLAIYLCVGAAGGYLGDRLRLPAGVLIGSMVAVILFRMVMHRPWSVPAPYRFTVQVLLGVMLGISFVPEMLKLIARAAFPILLSTLVLVGVGILLALLFTRMGYVDITTAYLGTSPGAMSAILCMGLVNEANGPIILCFHFLRVLFVNLTAPLVLKYLSG
jgi:membrane AbrB-like protein